MKKTAIILSLLCIALGGWAGVWTGTWATAVEFAGEEDMPKTVLANCAVRQVVHVSIGGRALRLKLSNEFSNEPVEIKSVYIADALDSSLIDTGTARYLTFAGRRSTTILPGSVVTSDELGYDLHPLGRLTVTINYGSRVPQRATCHRGSRTTSYIMTRESRPRKPFATTERVEHWYNIAAIEVLSEGGSDVVGSDELGVGSVLSCIAILGNSITDGRGTTTDLQNRWTDRLAEYLEGKVGVLNLGIGGNCVLEGGLGQPGMQRFERDILAQQGVTHLIIFEGINDIGTSKASEETARRLIEAYEQLIRTAHERGLKVILATITPLGNTSYWSFFHEAARQTVNEWIRTRAEVDGLIDFDELVRDPEHPTQMRADWQSDWLHPNAEGYRNMGEYAAKCLARVLR